MVPPSDSKIPADPQLFQATLSSQDENWAKGVLRFLWRQPFVLLGGLWLLMVVVAIVALGGLASPGEPEQPTVTRERRRPAPAIIPPRPRSTPSTPPTGSAFAPGEDAAGSADGTGEEDAPGFPLWSLAVLVGCCAAGSIIASRQINAPPVSRRRRTKKLVQPARRRPTPPPSPKAKRLKPYVAHPGSPPPSGEVAQADSAAIAAPAPRQPAISVVPDDEVHALDWPEGSLAHQLDLRQQKSLSSLL